MAIVKEEAVRRVDVHDGWVEVRETVTVGDVKKLTANRGLQELASGDSSMMFELLTRFIVAWSYEDEVTPENIEALDWDAATSVMGVIGELLGTNQKKELNGSTPHLAESGTRT